MTLPTVAPGTPVRLPVENVNDESATVLEWHVQDGDWVSAGTPLVTVETSKATVEIPAPVDGFARFQFHPGEDAPVGAVICYLMESREGCPEAAGDAASEERVAVPCGMGGVSRAVAGDEPTLLLPPLPGGPATGFGIGRARFASGEGVSGDDVPAEPPTEGEWSSSEERPATVRFSSAAKRTMESRGLDPAAFASRGLVRECDLTTEAPGLPRPAESSCEENLSSPAAASAKPNLAGVETRVAPLSRRKLIEASILAAGMSNALASSVTVLRPTHRLRPAAESGRFDGSLAARMIFEVARLLRAYPELNGFHASGSIHYYEQVNVGFAIDAGRGLKVPVIRNADQKSMVEIVGEVCDLAVKYLDDQLTPEDLSGGTFTISDLSGAGAFTFSPLLIRGQSAILGVGADVILPGSPVGVGALILAFDHQVSEGRQAAAFLSDLSRRIEAYEAGLGISQRAEAPAVPVAACSMCRRSVDDLEPFRAYLLDAISKDGTRRPVCSFCVAGW